MAKDLVLNVVAKKNSRQLTELAAEFQGLSDAATLSGKKIDKSFTAFLDQQIAGTSKELARLRQEFEKTGDLKVAADIGGLERNLKGLTQLRKTFGVAGQEAGKSFGQKFSDGLNKALGGGGTVEEGGLLKSVLLSPAGIGGAAVVASAAGVMIGGALLTGIGLAGVGAGIAGQLHSPEVKAALSGFKTDLSTGFQDATASFAKPTAEAVSIFDTAWRDALPGLQDTFKALAPEVTVLAHGAAGFASNLLTGLEHAAVAAKPLLDDLGQWLPSFGKDVGSVFDTIASHQQEALEGLHSIEDFLSGLTIAAKGAVDVLSGIWDVAKYAGSEQQLKQLNYQIGAWLTGTNAAEIQQRILTNTSESVRGAVSVQTDAIKKSAGANYDWRSSAQAAADAERELTAGFEDQANKLLGLENAQDAYQKGLNDLGDQLDKNNHTLKGNSDAAIQNRQAIRDLIGQALAMRQAAIDQAGGTNASSDAIKKANDQYEAAIGKLEALSGKLGISKADLDALVGEYNIDINVNVAGSGKSVINSDGTITIGGHSPKLQARAGGGPVSAGTPYLVGENGPELMVPNSSGVIIPKLPAPAAFSPRSAAGSTGGVAGVAVSASRDAVAAALAPIVNYLIRTGGVNLRVDSSGRVVAA